MVSLIKKRRMQVAGVWNNKELAVADPELAGPAVDSADLANNSDW